MPGGPIFAPWPGVLGVFRVSPRFLAISHRGTLTYTTKVGLLTKNGPKYPPYNGPRDLPASTGPPATIIGYPGEFDFSNSDIFLGVVGDPGSPWIPFEVGVKCPWGGIVTRAFYIMNGHVSTCSTIIKSVSCNTKPISRCMNHACEIVTLGRMEIPRSSVNIGHRCPDSFQNLHAAGPANEILHLRCGG